MTITDAQINAKYESGTNQLITETISVYPAVLLDDLDRGEPIRIKNLEIDSNWSSSWDETRQSRLIESLLINIPVQPIILYEKIYHQLYEVIDGKERLETIKKFFTNHLELIGLEVYPELDGKSYFDLPHKIKDRLSKKRINFIAFFPLNNKTNKKELEKIINAAKDRLAKTI
jgi:Protein of unknown function DUF262